MKLALRASLVDYGRPVQIQDDVYQSDRIHKHSHRVLGGFSRYVNHSKVQLSKLAEMIAHACGTATGKYMCQESGSNASNRSSSKLDRKS